MMGKEYSKEKLTEHRARLTELELFVKEMKIPRAYDNKYFSKDYEKKVLKVLDAQSIEYRKYIQNNLKQLNMLSHQTKDLESSEVKKLKKKIESKEHVSKFFNTDEEEK